MVCPHCGKPVGEQDRLCQFCGRELPAGSLSSSAAPQKSAPPSGLERRRVSFLRRRSPRVEVQIPLVVQWVGKGGGVQREATETRMVSAHGCVVSLKGLVFDGSAVELVNPPTAMTRKGRVTFLGGTGPDGRQDVGIELEEPDPSFWGAPYAAVAPWTGDERRRCLRYKQGGSVELTVEGAEVGTRVELSDISRDGCYVTTMSPLPAGTWVRALLQLGEETIRAEAVVRASHPAMGMGLQFTQLDSENTARLDKLLAQLAEKVKSSSPR